MVGLTAIALAPDVAMAQPIGHVKPPIRRLSSAPRPIVVIGGWSNCPANFTQTPLVAALKAQRGAERVLLTTHANAWGDIDANAAAEAGQIRAFMDGLHRGGPIGQTDVDVDVIGFSMGGLVARAIVTKHADALGSYRVTNLVTLATPNHGANPTLADVADVDRILRPTTHECPSAPARYSSTVAAQEMLPHSTYLNDLNGRSIPASIRVTTIAGEMLADPITVQPSLCDASCGLLGNLGVSPVIPSGTGLPHDLGTMSYVDQWHGQCEIHTGGRGTGRCKSDTRCIPGFDRFQEDGVWKCRGPRSDSITMGTDGLIRVTSVHLEASEASNIAGQHVVKDVYHTMSTRDAARDAPNPKPMTDARGARPDQPGRPMIGTPRDASWYFAEPRVIDHLTHL
jgi:pimeloyl-ACP methyl ester carboxylesterase